MAIPGPRSGGDGRGWSCCARRDCCGVVWENQEQDHATRRQASAASRSQAGVGDNSQSYFLCDSTTAHVRLPADWCSREEKAKSAVLRIAFGGRGIRAARGRTPTTRVALGARWRAVLVSADGRTRRADGRPRRGVLAPLGAQCSALRPRAQAVKTWARIVTGGLRSRSVKGCACVRRRGSFGVPAGDGSPERDEACCFRLRFGRGRAPSRSGLRPAWTLEIGVRDLARMSKGVPGPSKGVQGCRKGFPNRS